MAWGFIRPGELATSDDTVVILGRPAAHAPARIDASPYGDCPGIGCGRISGDSIDGVGIGWGPTGEDSVKDLSVVAVDFSVGSGVVSTREPG
mmetsp:Transcript_9660/g.13901  ORF Transcript_9660/g.13901 Transcript_9660/m.13901 type:complete len:92 (+) Transcript_9660:400-675(+)